MGLIDLQLIWVDLRVHRFLDKKTVLATSYPWFGSMGQIPLHSAPRLRNALKQEAIGVVRSEVTSEKNVWYNRIMWEKQCHKPAMTGNGFYPYTSYGFNHMTIHEALDLGPLVWRTRRTRGRATPGLILVLLSIPIQYTGDSHNNELGNPFTSICG